MLSKLHAFIAVILITLAAAPRGEANIIYYCTSATEWPPWQIGHVWLEFYPPGGNPGTAGFYPASKKDGLAGKPGRVSYADRSTKTWTTRWCYDLPTVHYNNIVRAIKRDRTNPPGYHLTPRQAPGGGGNYNCASWAGKFLDAEGFTAPNAVDPLVGEPSPRGAAVNAGPHGSQGPGGSTVEHSGSGPGLLPSQLASYPAGVAYPGLEPTDLLWYILEDRTSFNNLTGISVFDIARPAVTGYTADFYGVQTVREGSSIFMTCVDWGDGSGTTYPAGLILPYHITSRHTYTHIYDFPGTYEVRAVIFMENGAEIHSFTVNVSNSPPGHSAVLHRNVLDPGSYSATPPEPYPNGSMPDEEPQEL